jgi:transcriptional regulator with XRE-family HTH domain
MDPSVASPRINQYERAKHLPDPLTLERLGRVLDCPLPFFYAIEDDLAQQILAFHRATDRQRRQLSVLARKSAASERQSVVHSVKV